MIYHQLLLTDYNPLATQKYDVGSSLVILGIFNFMFPNFFLLIKEWKEAFQSWAEERGYLVSRKQKIINDFLDKCSRTKLKGFLQAQERADRYERMYWESQYKTYSRNNMQIMPWEIIDRKIIEPEDWNFYDRRYRQEHKRKFKAAKLKKMQTIVSQRKQLMKDMIKERVKQDQNTEKTVTLYKQLTVKMGVNAKKGGKDSDTKPATAGYFGAF